ncbi:MAG: transcription antitermination factor NusB, partial [Thermoanaerobaculia bacterium]
IKMVSCSNNHAYDFGENGILTNIRNLDKYDMPHAGTGRNMSEARSPAYLDTPKGRIALLSVTSSGPQVMRAGEQWRDGSGRPGANLLRYMTQYTVDRPVFNELRRLSEGLGFESFKAHRRTNPWQGHFAEDNDNQFFLPSLANEWQYPEPNGTLFKVGDTFGTEQILNQADVEGTLQRKAEIDDLLRSQADHWRLERMPVVDRNILRVAVYEFLSQIDVPKLVVIDEAIELAKKFGSEESGRFVNGLLDGLLKEKSFPGTVT